MPTQLALSLDDVVVERPEFLTEQLITYIGNKRSLLPFIGLGLDRARTLLGRERVSFLDLFAGSGVVSRFAKSISHHIIANDFEEYSAVASRCYLANASEVDWGKLEDTLDDVRAKQCADPAPGFITELYAPREEEQIVVTDRVFYTRRNAIFIDSACRALSETSVEFRDLLLGPLLSAASVHANTSGVFKGFYKDKSGKGRFGGSAGDALKRILQPIEWRLPILSAFEASHEVYRLDANDLVNQLDHVDVAYLDPPYNQHPYGSNYFMLNLIAKYRKPNEISRVSGIPTDWQRSGYNKRSQSATLLFDSIAKCPADIVLISYSSEGFIKLDEFHHRLRDLGKLEILDTVYNTFRGCRNLQNRDHLLKEFVFLLDKR